MLAACSLALLALLLPPAAAQAHELEGSWASADR